MMKKIAMSSACVVVGITRRASARTLATGSKNLSAKRKENVLPPEGEITKSVFMSQSTDIYTNLALEDWMYRNMDFSKHHVMMVWRNEPCVVIGRHQNPWLEANLPALSEKEIALARRNSGGGTVYHDRGNLNITFFTPKERYDRKYNLELITRALYRGFGVKANINERQDIVVQDKYKVSFLNAIKMKQWQFCLLCNQLEFHSFIQIIIQIFYFLLMIFNDRVKLC